MILSGRVVTSFVRDSVAASASSFSSGKAVPRDLSAVATPLCFLSPSSGVSAPGTGPSVGSFVFPGALAPAFSSLLWPALLPCPLSPSLLGCCLPPLRACSRHSRPSPAQHRARALQTPNPQPTWRPHDAPPVQPPVMQGFRTGTAAGMDKYYLDHVIDQLKRSEGAAWVQKQRPTFFLRPTFDQRNENLRRYLAGYPWIVIARDKGGYFTYFCALCKKAANPYHLLSKRPHLQKRPQLLVSTPRTHATMDG